MSADSVSILVVDDNDAHCYALTKMLQARKATVLQAHTGQQALTLVSSDTDIILLDIHLPDMTGYDVLKQLRSRRDTQGLPVVLMSAVEAPLEARMAAQSHGVSSFLTLPVVSSDLWIVIEANLERHRSA